MPQAALLKLLSRSLFATCNYGLVANFGNIGTTQKWHVPNHPTKKKETGDRTISQEAEHMLCTCAV